MNKPDIKNRRVRKLLLLGSIIAILIAISPYLFYLYEIFPETKTWKTSFFTLKTSFFSSLYIAAWYFANKLIPLYLLFLWFLTCRHWWYHVILIPITMYAFQIASAINDDIGYIEEVNFYYTLPVILFISSIAYPLRVKLLSSIMEGIDVKTLSIEKNREQKTKKSLKRVIFTRVLVTFLIAVSPFIFYVYRNFPEDSDTWEIFFFTFRSVHYSSIHMAVWNFMNKFVPLYLLLLWFLTCRHWWKYIILIPMTLYIFQLYSILNSSIKYADEMEIYWLIPVILVTAAVVHTLRLKLFYKVIRGVDLEKLDKELESYEADNDLIK